MHGFKAKSLVYKVYTKYSMIFLFRMVNGKIARPKRQNINCLHESPTAGA